MFSYQSFLTFVIFAGEELQSKEAEDEKFIYRFRVPNESGKINFSLTHFSLFNKNLPL